VPAVDGRKSLARRYVGFAVARDPSRIAWVCYELEQLGTVLFDAIGTETGN
jgi:hypothetical protein